MNREATPAFRLDRIIELTRRAALGPSSKILAGFRNPALAVEWKSDGSPVTALDREAEQQIREILKSDPDHIWPVLGEEFGGDTTGSQYRWVVDPIDGTMPFSRGLPYFGTLVAFEETSPSRALAGAIQLPAFAELYTAARGTGAHCNGSPISVAPRRDLANCMVSAPEIQKFRVAGLEEGYERLGGVVRYFRGNGDCWMHAMAARGAVDAVVEFSLNRWDIAATEVIVEEAGGLFFTRPSRTVPRKYDTVFGSAQAAEEIVKLLDFKPE
ncbi:MAG: histidinol-phosphatase [Gammaproteobacteria bacterium]|jgi:histidinol-phosphatase|nr:histidinol-phosphatase [Gammaproteobacteria bacterium]